MKTNDEFHSLWAAEVQNRAFARKSACELAQSSTEDGEALGAKVTAWLAVFSATHLPHEQVVTTLLEGTRSYLAPLRKLVELAPEEDKAFFRFVHDQEVTQVEALEHRLQHRDDDAAAALQAFMAKNGAAPENSTDAAAPDGSPPDAP